MDESGSEYMGPSNANQRDTLFLTPNLTPITGGAEASASESRLFHLQTPLASPQGPNAPVAQSSQVRLAELL